MLQEEGAEVLWKEVGQGSAGSLEWKKFKVPLQKW